VEPGPVEWLSLPLLFQRNDQLCWKLLNSPF
jgi:hypothetical protein